MFSGEETFTLTLLGGLLIGIPLVNLLNKDYRRIWSPMTMICLVYFYYCFLGGINAVVSEDTLYRLLDHRPYFLQAWQGGLVALVSILVGFNISKNQRKKIREYNVEGVESQLFRLGRITFIIGFTMYFITVGGAIGSKITFWEQAQGGRGLYGGAFRAYFALGVNILTTGVALLFANFMIRKNQIAWLLATGFVTTGFYLTAGFRYRIVILTLTMLATYYLIKKVRPNPVFVGGIGIVFIGLMGVINYARTYSRGLDLERITDKGNEELVLSGLKETYTFQTTGLMMHKVDEEVVEKIGFSPIWESIVSPIPRAIWKNKPTGSYLDRILIIYSGDPDRVTQRGRGAAVLNYGEYYLAFGWFGIIAYGLLLGWGCGKLWSWFLQDSTNPLRIVGYAACNAYLYMVLSRGYLPQVTMLFFFTAFPGVYIHNRVMKKLKPARVPEE